MWADQMKIRIRAVVIAFVAELALDQIISAILLVVFDHTGFSPDMSDAERQAFVTAVWSDGAFVLSAFVLGTATTVFGGYVCARVAGRAELKGAAVMAVISTVFGLLMTMHVPRDAFNTVMLVASFVIVVAGGYAGARRNARNP